MKPLSSRSGCPAFTLIELLVVISIISILAGMLLPSLARAKAKAHRINCVSNLKQVGLGLRMWADDNEGRYPWVVATSEGGSKTLSQAWQHFQVIQTELSSPKVLRCPSDRSRSLAQNFLDTTPDGLPTLKDEAVSFLIGTDAREENPGMHVAGDRNVISENGDGGKCDVAGLSGVITYLNPVGTSQVPKSSNPRWDSGIHVYVGNMTFTDGSVQQLSTTQLRSAMKVTGDDNLSDCSLKPR